MEFNKEEQFYRAIKQTNPSAWDSEKNRPSSAAFKDSLGCSVDRRNLRPEDEVLSFMHNNLDTDDSKIKSIVSVTKAQCDEKEIQTKEDAVKDDPILKDNPHHCLLIRNEDRYEMTKGQCRHLSNCCTISENNEEIEFVSKST